MSLPTKSEPYSRGGGGRDLYFACGDMDVDTGRVVRLRSGGCIQGQPGSPLVDRLDASNGRYCPQLGKLGPGPRGITQPARPQLRALFWACVPRPHVSTTSIMHTAQRLLTGVDDLDQDRPSARPATVTVYGPKGFGEGGAMAPAAVITNEVRDMLLALRVSRSMDRC